MKRFLCAAMLVLLTIIPSQRVTPFPYAPTQVNSLVVKTAPSGPDKTTTSTQWVDVPDMSAYIVMQAGNNLEITFSAEANTSNDKRMFVRALVDGKPAQPGDVVFALGGYTGVHVYNFTMEGLSSGSHEVRAQWLVDSGGTAYLGDRTLTLNASPGATDTTSLIVKTAPSGPDKVTTSPGWVDMPDMNADIVMQAGNNLEITFSVEANTSNAKRMFVRALVDGKPAQPGDVVFAMGAYTGVHAYNFTMKGLSSGSHAVRAQWLVDSGGTAYLGDRTMTLNAAKIVTRDGGLNMTTAPSGADKTTTSANWTDIPDMLERIDTVADSGLEITFSAEANTSSSDKRLFVRALVDGKPAQPSDVLFAMGGYNGTRSYTFTVDDLSAKTHEVRLQWSVDSGGTAYLGDRTMTSNSWRGQVPDLNKAFYDLRPLLGNKRVVTILWDPHRPNNPAPSKVDVEKLIYGPDPSVKDYFREGSGGRFAIDNAGILGWYDAQHSWDYYWRTDSSSAYYPAKWQGTSHYFEDKQGKYGKPGNSYFVDFEGFISGHSNKWTEAITMASSKGFNFGNYDTNRDGVLAPQELTILIVIPQNEPFGTQRPVVARQFPSEQQLVVNGVRIDTMVEAYIGNPLSLGTVAHELYHILGNTADMYFDTFYPYAAGAFSIMDQSPNNPPHLDPFHKARLGWITPRVVTGSGTYSIPNVETSHEILVLYNPAQKGDREYFIIENRWPGSSYDRNLPDQGLAIWHVIEDRNVFGSLPAPKGVDAAKWQAIPPGDWGRRAIQMIRPVYGPPFRDNLALWNGAEPGTGYDLLPIDPDPSHITLTWGDGTPTNFSIKSISTSAQNMSVYIEVK